jgi:signal transduction histidine kinase
VIAVDDDGPGIPVDARERVFERFARLDEGRARDGGGTGLGLAVCRAIVTAHGGTVGLRDSALGGACVAIRLPIVPIAPSVGIADASTRSPVDA